MIPLQNTADFNTTPAQIHILTALILSTQQSKEIQPCNRRLRDILVKVGAIIPMLSPQLFFQ